MCLAPCYQGCTDERYGEEAGAVESFLATRGESRLVTLRTERDQASASLEFETAAALHAQVQKVEAVRALASELVRPLSQLRAVMLQASANPDEVAVFLFEEGRLRGPAVFSTMGMRIQNEQSGSTSLFAQPMAIEAVVEEQGIGNERAVIREQGIGNDEAGNREQGIGNSENPAGDVESVSAEAGGIVPVRVARGVLEGRMEAVVGSLEETCGAPSATVRQAHLALLKRWYYRAEAKRTGEIFFPDGEGEWPVKAMLRGAGRVAAKMLNTSAGASDAGLPGLIH